MRLLDERTYAFQWDSNIYVVLPKANVGDEVHFAHRKDKKSLVVIAKEIDTTVVAGASSKCSLGCEQCHHHLRLY